VKETYEVVFHLSADDESLFRWHFAANEFTDDRFVGDNRQLMLALNLILHGRILRVAVDALGHPATQADAQAPRLLPPPVAQINGRSTHAAAPSFAGCEGASP
jgi:hypothetical protein